MPSARVRDFVRVAGTLVWGSSTKGSAVISSRQVSGVRRASACAAPISLCGFGSPRETSPKSLPGVRYGLVIGAVFFSGVASAGFASTVSEIAREVAHAAPALMKSLRVTLLPSCSSLMRMIPNAGGYFYHSNSNPAVQF